MRLFLVLLVFCLIACSPSANTTRPASSHQQTQSKDQTFNNVMAGVGVAALIWAAIYQPEIAVIALAAGVVGGVIVFFE